MAKHHLEKQTSTETVSSPTSRARRPEGYTKAETFVDPAGYWIPEHGPIHGYLLGAYEYRQKTGKGRGQLRRIYLVKLLDTCTARCKDATGKLDEHVLRAGELCAVFGSVGLRELNDLWRCKVYVERLGKKTLPSGNDMWEYDISYEGKRKAVRVRPMLSNSAEPPAEAVPTEMTDADFDEYGF